MVKSECGGLTAWTFLNFLLKLNMAITNIWIKVVCMTGCIDFNHFSLPCILLTHYVFVGIDWLWAMSYLPTLPVFPGVSKFFIKSPGLPVRAPNLADKMDFWAFLCFSLKFSPFFHKIQTFFIHCTVSGTFLHMLSQ